MARAEKARETAEAVRAANAAEAEERRRPRPPAVKVSIARPVAGIVIVALAFTWLLLAFLDLRENDGVGPLIAMFGIPALAAAFIIQIATNRMGPGTQPSTSFLWWALLVLPLGTLGGFVVAIIREPEYFIGDEGPWMLIWVPIFIVVGLLLGALVWFFFVFPIVALVKVIGMIARGQAKISAITMPLVLLSLGVLCIIGGLSIDTEHSGRAAWGAVIASFLGLPGSYEVVWEPGLWIVRGIVAAIVLVWMVPALRARLSSDKLLS